MIPKLQGMVLMKFYGQGYPEMNYAYVHIKSFKFSTLANSGLLNSLPNVQWTFAHRFSAVMKNRVSIP